MKNRVMKVAIVVLLLLTTGCTKYIQDDNKKLVTNETTGQNLTSNILCKPTDEKLIEMYMEHEGKTTVKWEDLPECKNFKPNDLKYNGLWETILIKPLAWVIIQGGNLVGNYGLSVMLIGLLIRIFLLPLSLKSAKQSQNMKKAQPEIQRIEKKYEGKKDSTSQMQKSQETMAVYQKYKMNPISGCLSAFIQLPLFLSFLEAINRVPAIFEGNFLTMNLGMTPWVGLTSGQYIYIVLIGLIVLTTFLQFKFSMSGAGGMGGMMDAPKQMMIMQGLMVVMISVASLRLPTAIALYWIVTNGFAIIQNVIVKRSVR